MLRAVRSVKADMKINDSAQITKKDEEDLKEIKKPGPKRPKLKGAGIRPFQMAKYIELVEKRNREAEDEIGKGNGKKR